MNWEALAQKAISPFGAKGPNLKAYAIDLLKEAELDFAQDTKAIETEGVMWTGTDIATGSLVVGVEYMSAGYTTVVHNSVTYTEGETFTAVNANYTTTGTGKVVLVTENQWVVDLPANYLEIKDSPTWNGRTLYLYNQRQGLEFRTTTEGTWGVSTPDYYFIQNKQLWLISGTVTNGRIDINYIAFPTETEQETDTPTIAVEYHIYLLDYAKAYLYEDQEKISIADRMMSKYERNRQRIGVQIFHANTPDNSSIRPVASSPVRVDRI